MLRSWLKSKFKARPLAEAPKAMTVESLEGRQMLSAASLSAPVPTPAPAAHAAAATARVQPMKHPVKTRAYLVAFYGLGGTGWDNSWLAKIADDAGAADGYAVSKYQETDADAAVKNFLAALDTNGDHVIDASETANVTVSVVGYSFGAIAGSNFTRDLTITRKAIDGYKLSSAVMVKNLITLDPVNYTGLRYTAGPLANVQNFTSYYETNPGTATMTLLDKNGHHVGSVTFDSGLGINPIGTPLASAAQNTTQIEVDQGAWADTTVTHAYDATRFGRISGSGVNHETMPFFLYDFVEADLKG